MYRLPNQFTPSASQIQSAAGGGSTTTTCSCCVVTAAGASILTAIHFASLKKDVPATAPIGADISPSEFSMGSPPVDRADPSDPPDVQAGGRAMLGLLSLVIAVGAGALVASIGGLTLGSILAIGTFVAIFALAYESARLSPRAGVIAGIAAVLLIALSTAIELFIWLS